MIVGKSEIFDTWYVEVFYLFSMEYLPMEFLLIIPKFFVRKRTIHITTVIYWVSVLKDFLPINADLFKCN